MLCQSVMSTVESASDYRAAWVAVLLCANPWLILAASRSQAACQHAS